MRTLILGTMLVLAAPGCSNKDPDTYEGTYEGYLRQTHDLASFIRIDYWDSKLTATFYTDADGEPKGFVVLHGSFYIIGFHIFNWNGDPYPLKDVAFDLSENALDATVVIDGYPNLGIDGVFSPHYRALTADVHLKLDLPAPPLLGTMTFYKLDTSPPETGDTGVVVE